MKHVGSLALIHCIFCSSTREHADGGRRVDITVDRRGRKVRWFAAKQLRTAGFPLAKAWLTTGGLLFTANPFEKISGLNEVTCFQIT